MIALLQRVSTARVMVADVEVGSIDQGLLALIGIERGDGEAEAVRLLERALAYRVFSDEQGRMNASVSDISGGLLLVPQFTLAADTRKGNRPSFTPAADPAIAEPLFNQLVTLAKTRHAHIATGQFGADMQVSLTNDGPVTFWLQTGQA